VLGENGVKINKSCGLHIHFDAQNMTANHLKNLVINYGNFESVIDSFLPESRRGNNNTYCKSVRSLEAQISSATTIRKMAEAIGSRYYKLNLQSYLRHQTIEFRQHSGTVEYTKISNWILFLHNLVEYSATKRISQTEGTMENLKKFNQPEVINYIITRQNQLAA
jgi:Putative amidoligase enzyme